MEADRFDTLSRTLSAAPSRRTALRLLAGSVFGSLVTLTHDDAAAHDALLECKKKKGKQKKKCLKKAKAHNGAHTTPAPPGCIRSCAGKTCGSDGCSGSCGTCGIGSECCRGGCLSTCFVVGNPWVALHPETCGCCMRGDGDCGPQFVPCCNGSTCEMTENGPKCQGQAEGQSCEFNGQCYFGAVCTNGKCRCANSSNEVCNGRCVGACPSGWIRDPESCGCCISSRSSTTCGGQSQCCSYVSGGANVCQSGTCIGRADGASCTFSEQCRVFYDCVGGVCKIQQFE
jgi:hypothetical protein